MCPESLPTLLQSPSGSCPVPRAGAGRSRAEWDEMPCKPPRRIPGSHLWLYAAGEEAGEGTYVRPGTSLARSLQLWQCVCRTLKGASAILRNASVRSETELLQNTGKASHGSLSIRQSGRLLACVVCSIHGVHHTLLFFIFHNFTLHSTESSSNPHRAVLLLLGAEQRNGDAT